MTFLCSKMSWYLLYPTDFQAYTDSGLRTQHSRYSSLVLRSIAYLNRNGECWSMDGSNHAHCVVCQSWTQLIKSTHSILWLWLRHISFFLLSNRTNSLKITADNVQVHENSQALLSTRHMSFLCYRTDILSTLKHKTFLWLKYQKYDSPSQSVERDLFCPGTPSSQVNTTCKKKKKLSMTGT